MAFMFSCSGDISLRRRPQSMDCARKIYTRSLSAILFRFKVTVFKIQAD